MPSDPSADSNESDPPNGGHRTDRDQGESLVHGRHRARLFAIVAARGLKVFTAIDHSDEARRVGLALQDTKVFIVGSPSVTTPLVDAAPLTRLRDWVAELIDLRNRPVVDEWEG